MKIVGNIEICNRLLPSLNVAGKSRSQWSSLGIGKQPGTESVLFIFHQSAQNKLGTRYKVKDNIEQVFTRFMNEGKATIRFKTPPHDVCIKCDPMQLKLFLRTLKLGLENKLPTQALTLSNITPSKRVPPAPRTKITVLSKATYPTLEGFPRTVQSLKINNVEQKKFDKKILRLQSLRHLDLCNNELTSLPEEIGSLPSLQCLLLAHNKFGEIPANDARWNWISSANLIKNLQVLDLSSNELTMLPNQLCKLKSLDTLKVEKNQLIELPPGIGNLPKLRTLTAGHNRLQFLPGSMKRLCLEFLDLTYNTFQNATNGQLSINLNVPSLLECAARRVIKSRLFYSAELIPRTLVKYLDNAHYCVCGSACFETFARKFIPLQLKKISSTVMFTEDSSTIGPTDAYFCSLNCLNQSR